MSFRSQLSVVFSLSLLVSIAQARDVRDFAPVQQNETLGDYSYLIKNGKKTQSSVAKTGMKKGTIILVDTRDRETCSKIEEKLAGLRVQGQRTDRASICTPESNSRPINVVTVMSASDETEFKKEINISGMLSTDKNVVTETRNLFLASLGVVGALYMMPESVTKWDKNDARNIGEKWKDNVTKGPVMDKDDWAINYIGHPVSGAIYYQVARGLDMSPLQAFGYSFVMSTFFWEYGVEAFAETPSIQDLWSTPILGALMGEIFYRLENRIKANGGEVMGSKRAGNMAMILLNPASALSDKINNVLGKEVIQSAKLELFSKKSACVNTAQIGEDYLCNRPINGLKLQFKF